MSSARAAKAVCCLQRGEERGVERRRREEVYTYGMV